MSLEASWNESSQEYGIPGTWPTTMRLTSAQALLRSAPAGIVVALVMASSISGTSSIEKLTLPCGLIAAPLNVGSSSDCGSVKSRNHPTFGQRSQPEDGTLQKRVYRVSCGTLRNVSLKPSCCSWPCATVAVCRPGSALVAIVSSFSPPVYLPSSFTGTPSAFALSMYCLANSGSPVGFCIQSNSEKPFSPPDSSNPGTPGGR